MTSYQQSVYDTLSIWHDWRYDLVCADLFSRGASRMKYFTTAIPVSSPGIRYAAEAMHESPMASMAPSGSVVRPQYV